MKMGIFEKLKDWLHLKTGKAYFMVCAMVLCAVAPVTHAIPYSDSFQGMTFTFNQLDADTLSFNIAGTPTGDWASAQYLGAFDLKNLGLDFSTGNETGTAYGPGTPGGGLLGLNSQLSASNLNCSSSSGGDDNICFDISPDVALGATPIDFTYIIDFSDVLNISSAGPHLQIAFTVWNEKKQTYTKVGTLYSNDVPGVNVPEPASLALLGLGLVGVRISSRLKLNRI